MIQPRYAIGETVWHAHVVTGTKQVECPDCLGTTIWVAILPGGGNLEIKCPTCTYGYEHLGTIGQFEVSGSVRCLTIGSIRLDTDENPERQISYMCKETGVGSGAVFHEWELSPKREDAENALPRLIESKRIELAESQALSFKRRKSDGPGRMTAYYRAQIRDAQDQIEKAERGLERESRGQK